MEKPFEHVFAWDFYDGPESGLAVRNEREVLAFKVLAESDDGMNRAYSFRPVVDCVLIRSIVRTACAESTGFLPTETEDAILPYLQPVTMISVGNSWLTDAEFAPATQSDVEAMQETGSCERAYAFVARQNGAG